MSINSDRNCDEFEMIDCSGEGNIEPFENKDEKQKRATELSLAFAAHSHLTAYVRMPFALSLCLSHYTH